MEPKSNALLKVAGILMIIFGSVSIVIGAIAVIGVSALAIILGSEANIGLLTFGAILVLVSGVVSLIAGIVGVKNAKKPEKATTCIVFGVLTALLSVLGSVVTMIGGGDLNVISLAFGLVLPALYLVGAFQNKKLAG